MRGPHRVRKKESGRVVWETIAIIVTLGGLELTLWFLDRRAARRDHEMQRKQLEILDGILTEVAIQNSQDVDIRVQPQVPDVPDEGGRAPSTNRNPEHTACN